MLTLTCCVVVAFWMTPFGLLALEFQPEAY